ncbi:MAG: DUF169 domain-containing protein [Bacteroidales bacterium]|nr:DUF169 domain-containing protein [Bacteroidales bacterium]
MIDKLKKKFGPKCAAININGEVNEFINIPSKQMKFCEAVDYSFNIPLRLNPENLGCPGARRCIGFDNEDRQLAIAISGNNNIPAQFVQDALNNVSKLQSIRHINLGLTEYMEKDTKPDLYIVYVKPDNVTTVMHNLAKYSTMPSIPPYSLLSVCGNVFANCYINKLVSVSFGCPESRKCGGIEKDEVVMGIPYKTALQLIRDNKV